MTASVFAVGLQELNIFSFALLLFWHCALSFICNITGYDIIIGGDTVTIFNID